MLAKSSLQPSSIPTYRQAWKLFYQFLNAIFHSVVTELPISPHTLALFIAYMYGKNYAPSTVSSYVLALGYSHRLLSFPDPTKAFFIIQMLKGYTKLGSRLDSRLPITLPILHRIIEGASQLAISQLHCCQFQAMCAIAFYGFLRIGEITSNSLKNAAVPLQVHQLVKLIDTSQHVVALKIVFGNFKHNYNQRPFSIVISRQASVCPVLLLLDYLAIRGKSPGPLFMNQGNSPVSRSFFTDLLNRLLRTCGLNPALYKGHSFRIGASSFAADRVMSEAQIRALGQWKSNAFLKYIRIPSMST